MFTDGRTDDGRTDGRQAHRYIPRTFRSGDKNKRTVKFIAEFNSSLNKFLKYSTMDNAVNVLNKCSKFHLIAVNNSPVIQVHNWK